MTAAECIDDGKACARNVDVPRRSFANPTRTSKSWSNRVNVFIVVYVQRLDVNMWMFTFTVYVQGLNVRGVVNIRFLPPHFECT